MPPAKKAVSAVALDLDAKREGAPRVAFRLNDEVFEITPSLLDADANSALSVAITGVQAAVARANSRKDDDTDDDPINFDASETEMVESLHALITGMMDEECAQRWVAMRYDPLRPITLEELFAVQGLAVGTETERPTE